MGVYTVVSDDCELYYASGLEAAQQLEHRPISSASVRTDHYQLIFASLGVRPDPR